MKVKLEDWRKLVDALDRGDIAEVKRIMDKIAHENLLERYDEMERKKREKKSEKKKDSKEEVYVISEEELDDIMNSVM